MGFIQSASVCTNSSQFPEESTVQPQTTFTLQDTANAPPQMLLDNPEHTIKHEQPTQEGISEQVETACTQEVTQKGYSSVFSTQCRSPRTQRDPQW